VNFSFSTSRLIRLPCKETLGSTTWANKMQQQRFTTPVTQQYERVLTKRFEDGIMVDPGLAARFKMDIVHPDPVNPGHIHRLP